MTYLTEKLKALVAEWRKEEEDGILPWRRTEADDVRARAYECCADALERVMKEDK